MKIVTEVQVGLRDAIGFALGEKLKWAIVIAHTDDGWEVVRSENEGGEEFDILRMAQEFNLAMRGLVDRELRRLAADGEANKEETP